MRKCAFCIYRDAGNDEHIWSDWMGKMLPHDRYNFRRISQDGVIRHFQGPKINLKAGVVCGECNHGWMSNLEAELQHSPFKEMMLNGTPVTLARNDIELIAAFAFKTIVIANHMKLREGGTFFTDGERTRFRRTHQLPAGFQVWLSMRQSRAKRTGIFKSSYGIHRHPRYGYEFYTLTWGLGHVIVQALAGHWTRKKLRKKATPIAVTQTPEMDECAIAVWPFRGPVKWPPPKPVTDDMIRRFCTRFDSLEIPPWMTD
jgi:hypothetical protein